jgi:surface polysaccharide O-acyltransferase-like enzyme
MIANEAGTFNAVSPPKTGTERTNFLPYIHNLRGLAILIIVGAHVRGFGHHWATNYDDFQYLRSLFDNGTILFVFIAGFLFPHLTHNNFKFGSYFTQKMKVVILPYVLISIPVIFYRVHLENHRMIWAPTFHENPIVVKWFLYFVTGMHLAPVWFIPMIFLVYLTSPLLHRLDNAKFYNVYFPVVFIAGMFTFRPQYNANPILACLHFLPIYMTGMWASFNRKKLFQLGNKLVIPLVIVYIMLSVLDVSQTIRFPKEFGFEQILSGEGFYFNTLTFKTIVFCFVLLLLFHHYANNKLKFLYVLADYSFGIFFVHQFFIIAVRAILPRFSIPDDYTFSGFSVFYLFVILASLATVWIVKTVTGNKSRYLIGS